MTIICKTCKSPKPEDDFYKAKNKSGHESSCKSCSDLRHYERRRERRIEQGLTVKFPTLANRQLAEEGMKYCPGCKQVKKLSEFSTMKVRSGVASHCRECSKRMQEIRHALPETKEKQHKYYKRNREKAIDRKLQANFGITYNQYKQMLDAQGGGCMICEKTPKENGKMLAVDHNHTTGENRGLLCSSCNICIGFIEKNQLDFGHLKWYIGKYKITKE
jgi:hypothetical protein